MNITNNRITMISLFNTKINLEAYSDKLAKNKVKSFILQGDLEKNKRMPQFMGYLHKNYASSRFKFLNQQPRNLNSNSTENFERKKLQLLTEVGRIKSTKIKLNELLKIHENNYKEIA